MSCKGEAKAIKELVLRLHAQAIANMITSTLKKLAIVEDQNIMTLFIVPDFELVCKEVNEYFMFQRREELGKLRARLQPTIIILANVNLLKEILDLTTPHGDSHEDEKRTIIHKIHYTIHLMYVGFWKCLISFKK